MTAIQLDNFFLALKPINMWIYFLKSRIQETKHLSTDADSSTDTTVGWTKNIQKPKFIEKRKKIIQNGKTQKPLEICQNLRYALRPEVSNHREAWFPG